MISNGQSKDIPVLNGLVLAGGKSTRMGADKGTLSWHGKEQRYHMADLLVYFCKNVFISCRTEQQNTIETGYQTLPDKLTGQGPYGAILSAFEYHRDAAWLVVACDLPLLDKNTLQYLTENRNPDAPATTFKSPHDGMPEPLVTIWEPRSYAVLLSFQSQGYKCPRKVLLNSEATILIAPNPAALMNVNTPEDAEKAKEILQKSIFA